jgi:hypothetical protein
VLVNRDGQDVGIGVEELCWRKVSSAYSKADSLTLGPVAAESNVRLVVLRQQDTHWCTSQSRTAIRFTPSLSMAYWCQLIINSSGAIEFRTLAASAVLAKMQNPIPISDVAWSKVAVIMWSLKSEGNLRPQLRYGGQQIILVRRGNPRMNKCIAAVSP